MAKLRSSRIAAGQHDALRQAADLIVKRAIEVTRPSAKERALELARLVLRAEPGFGGREMRDQQIVQVLEAEEIGLPTFRKALSTARKELVKKPVAGSPAKVVKQVGRGLHAPGNSVRAPAASGAIAPNVDRSVL